MTGDSWTLRAIEPSDIDLVRTLYYTIKQRNRPIGYDHWRFLGNPLGTSASVVAIDQGRCIGFQGVWPTEMRLGSETVLAGQLLDAMTDPAYRRRGVFSTLVEANCRCAAAAGLVAIYAFPNTVSLPIFVRRLDWDDIGSVPLWRRSLLPQSLRLRLPKEWPALRREFAKSVPAAELKFSVSDEFPEGFDALLAEWSTAPELCRVNRSRAWYQWRYSAASERECEWVSCHRDGRLVACGLWGFYKSSWQSINAGVAVLFDLLGTDSAALRAVLAGCVDRARSHGSKSLDALTNDPAFADPLRDTGFLLVDRRPLVVRKLTTRTLGGNLHHFPAWRVMTGDFDVS